MFISKRILIILGVIGILIIGGLGYTIFLLTQSSASADTPAVTPTPSVAITTTPTLNANRICAAGVIFSIDSGGQTIVVTEKGAKTVTVSTNAQTLYHERGFSGAAFSSLKVGQRVRITSQGGCDTTASTLTAKAITIVVAGATPTATP
jgi:hypothetical protein